MSTFGSMPGCMREVNRVFEREARAAGYWAPALVDELVEHGTLQGIPGVPPAHERVFVTAHDIAPEWHMRMQAAFQRHCDASISKTINFPYEATVDDVRKIYELAIDLDVKGVTVYRDGCRDLQPMALKGSGTRREAGAFVLLRSLPGWIRDGAAQNFRRASGFDRGSRRSG